MRFSQDSIQSTTSDGSKTLEQLTEDMLTNGWKKGTSLVAVQMPDGKLTSLNNRRLYTAQQAINQNNQFELSVSIYLHSDLAPKKMLSGIITEYKKGQQFRKIDEISENISLYSYGHATILRVNTRQGDLSHSIYGYEQTPIVR